MPSFYALEIMRAVTGRVPDHQTLERMAAQEAQREPRLAGSGGRRRAPSTTSSTTSSVLRGLMRSNGDVKGRAHYMLTLNDCLKRSVTERWARAQKSWSQYDGLVRVTDATRPFLQDAATERAAVFGVCAAAVRRMSVPILSLRCLSSRAARRARAASADGSVDKRESLPSGAGRVLPRAPAGEALNLDSQRNGCSKRWTRHSLASPRTITSDLRRPSTACGRTRSRACAPISVSGSTSWHRAPSGSPGSSSLRSACRGSPVTIQTAGRIPSRSTAGSSSAAAIDLVERKPGHADSEGHRPQDREESFSEGGHHRRGHTTSARHLQPRG